MVILNDQTPDALDITKNIITYLEGINQSTILSQNATVTDRTYTFADSDTMSDSTGYNNTIDTGNTTADFTVDRYFAQTSSSNESNAAENSRSADTFAIVKTMNLANAKKVTQHNNDLKSDAGSTCECKITFTYNDTTSATSTVQSTTSGTDVAKSYTNPNPEKLVTKIEVQLRNTSNTQLGFENDDVVTAFDFINGVVQTESKTFSANVKSILVSSNKTLNGNSTITIDVSTDGGSVFDVTGQAFDTVLELDGDNTGVVIKFNLNIDGTDTPELFGYSYQVWT